MTGKRVLSLNCTLLTVSILPVLRIRNGMREVEIRLSKNNVMGSQTLR